MKAVIQRVLSASVSIDSEVVGAIDQGLLALLAIEKDDDQDKADKLLEKILNYRVFADANNRMNLSLQTIGGGLLIVSQFTLAADTQKGLRPSFSTAAQPEQAFDLYQYFLARANSYT